jgi:hypothetical protein
MAQSKPRSALALTHSLANSKQRYPWAKAWVQVRGGIWCFETEQEARLYQPQTSHELFTESEPEKPKRPHRRKRRS